MDALKALLNDIYSTPAVYQTVGDNSNARPLSPDDFRMYIYKVVPCTRRGPHSWVECSFCHPGEKAARRDPQKFAYAPIACPDMKRDGRCFRGDACLMAHNIFEYWLHPARYRTQLCSYGVECKRSICFFCHQPGELRTSQYLAQLQALESEMEAQEPIPNPKWPTAGLQAQSSSGAKGGLQHRTSGAGNDVAQQRQEMQAFNLSQQSMLNALGCHLTQQGFPAMPHASMSAASAALLEAGLQPTTPPMGTPINLNPSLSPCSSLLTPLSSLNPVHEDSSLVASMKLLSDAMHKTPGRLQSVSSMPVVHAQQQQDSGSDIQQALHLLSQLQQLTSKATRSSAHGNSDLQAVLLSMLPQMLLQLGGGNAAPPPAAAAASPEPAQPVFQHPAALTLSAQRSASLSPTLLDTATSLSHSLLTGGNSFDIGQHQHQHQLPSAKSSPPRDSASPPPADMLSFKSCRNTGSNCSSGRSDGTHSPPLSHHSDEGIRTFAPTFPGLAKEELGGLTPATAALDPVVERHGPFSACSKERGGKIGLVVGGKEQRLMGARLPVSLDQDRELVSGMAEMSGAAGMIASLYQLVDSPLNSASRDIEAQLNQLTMC